MEDQNEKQQDHLDRRIVEELRQGTRTQKALVAELGAPHDQIRDRLQFLTHAGYVEKNEEADRYELRVDPENQRRWFDDFPYYVRVAASVGVMVLSGILYYGLFQLVLPQHTVLGGVVAIGLGLLTGWLAIPPRRQDDIRPDDPRNSPPYPPI